MRQESPSKTLARPDRQVIPAGKKKSAHDFAP
jgi:hypothetical protein